LGHSQVRRVKWEFGINWETAALLGGLTLLLCSIGGGLIGPLWGRRRGADEPKAEQLGTIHRLQRPDGSELQVEIYGPEDAPPLVMTHGWGLDHNEWYYARRQLGDRYRLILWDLPGLGASIGPRDKDGGLDRLACDLEAVLQLAGGRPAVLVGHSIGGMIILTFCKLFPEALGTRVCGLVLAHTTYTNPVRTMQSAGIYTALQKPVLQPLCHLMIWLAPLVWAMNWLSYLNGSAQRSTERASFSGRETRGQLQFLTRHFVSAWPAVMARGLLAMFRYDATAVLGTIQVPTLVVTGDKDSTCTPEASEFISRSIPGARLVTLEPAKHCGLFEHSVQFHEHLDAFAAKLTQTVS
jgi:pimeloyl-ACP methyl ester carboxylesterase